MSEALWALGGGVAVWVLTFARDLFSSWFFGTGRRPEDFVPFAEAARGTPRDRMVAALRRMARWAHR